MTQEDKELLKDLCARLPYGVIGEYSWKGNEPYDRELTGSLYDELNSSWSSTKDSKFIPYLRPMSSMTEEEISDLQKINCQFIFNKFDNFAYVGAADDGFCSVEEMDNILDYLDSKHFDYRGLIGKGLALEAPDGMYKY